VLGKRPKKNPVVLEIAAVLTPIGNWSVLIKITVAINEHFLTQLNTKKFR